MSFPRPLLVQPSVLRALFVLSFSLIAFSAAADPTRIALSFSDDAITISGATPNKQVALIGLMREPLGYYSRIRRVREVLDVAQDGTARFELKSERWWKSVWGAVDLTTGDVIVAKPERSPGQQVDFKGKGLGKGANGKLSKLEHEGQWLQLTVVKSNGDMLEALVIDGGPFDEDGENDNLVNVNFDALEPTKEKGEKGDEYHPGDVVFAVDPDQLTMVAVKVK